MMQRGVAWLVLISMVLAGCRSRGSDQGTPHAAISPVAGSSVEPGTPDPLAGWPQYINPGLRFSLRHPPDLQVQMEDPAGSIGWIGPRIQFAVTTANPLDCHGDCPQVDSVDTNAQAAGRTATRFFGSIGSIGGRTPQQYLSYTFWIDDQYYTFTVFALKNGEAKDRVDIIWPLADEDRRQFEQIVSTLEFGEVSAAASTFSPPSTSGASAGTKAPQGAMAHLPPGTPLTMKNIYLIDALNGWGIGGIKNNDEHTLRTQDGGATWLDVTPAEKAGPAGSHRKQALGFFRGSQRAWVAYWGGSPAPDAPRVWSTSDSGVTWTASATLDGSGMGPDYTPEFLDFPDADHGWLLVAHSPTDGRLPASLYHSEDGGLHWTRIFDPFQAQGSDLHTCCRVGMLFFDAFTGLIAHSNSSSPQPRLYWSRDSGQSWFPQDLPPADPTLFGSASCSLAGLGLQAPNSPAVAVACRDPSAPSNFFQVYLYTTQDGGQSWRSRPLPSPTNDKPPGQPASQDIKLVFISPDNGWAAINIGYTNAAGQSETRTYLFQTADGGNSWESRATLYWSGQFNFVSSLVGWAVASSGEQVALVKTTDGGQTWKVFAPKMGP